jgi:hypothetical protein
VAVHASSVRRSVSAQGTEGDGIFAIGLGLLALIGFALRMRMLAIVTSGITVAFTVVEFVLLADKASTATDKLEGLGTASVGPGIWVLAVAAITSMVVAVKLHWSS